MTIIKRTKLATSYFASGYGRGRNKRNVWLIDGYAFAYYPKYAEQAFKPLAGELKGYVCVNYEPQFGNFHACTIDEHKPYTGPMPSENVPHTHSEETNEATVLRHHSELTNKGREIVEVAGRDRYNVYDAGELIANVIGLDNAKQLAYGPNMVAALADCSEFLHERFSGLTLSDGMVARMNTINKLVEATS